MLLDRANHVQFVAVTGVGVGDHRNIDGTHDAGRVGDHLGHGHQAEIRITVRRGGAGAGHVDRWEAGLSDEPGGDAVIGARSDHHRLGLEQRAQPCGRCHELSYLACLPSINELIVVMIDRPH